MAKSVANSRFPGVLEIRKISENQIQIIKARWSDILKAGGISIYLSVR